jgi:hypothetical protein
MEGLALDLAEEEMTLRFQTSATEESQQAQQQQKRQQQEQQQQHGSPLEATSIPKQVAVLAQSTRVLELRERMARVQAALVET